MCTIIFINLYKLKERDAGFVDMRLIFQRTWLKRLDYIILPFEEHFEVFISKYYHSEKSFQSSIKTTDP